MDSNLFANTMLNLGCELFKLSKNIFNKTLAFRLAGCEYWENPKKMGPKVPGC